MHCLLTLFCFVDVIDFNDRTGSICITLILFNSDSFLVQVWYGQMAPSSGQLANTYGCLTRSLLLHVLRLHENGTAGRTRGTSVYSMIILRTVCLLSLNEKSASAGFLKQIPYSKIFAAPP